MIISRLCIWRKGLLTDANFRVESPQDFIHFRQQWQVWGSPKIILGFPNQLVLQGLTESCYTCSYGLFQIFDLFLIHFLFLMQYNGFAVLKMSVFVEQWISYTYTYPLLFRFFSRGATESFQKGKGVRQSCIFSPCLINLFAQYIMRNAGLDEAQAGVKTAGRNISNLR